VSRRTKEIGIRKTLGGGRWAIIVCCCGNSRSRCTARERDRGFRPLIGP
jgi:hypothetical protein